MRLGLTIFLMSAIWCAGCAGADAVHIERGAVSLIDGNSQPFKDAVKAAILSPEVHADLAVKIESTRNTSTAASQPATATDTGPAGRDKTWYQVPIQAIGDGGIIGAVVALWILCKMVRDVYRIARGGGRLVRKSAMRNPKSEIR